MNQSLRYTGKGSENFNHEGTSFETEQAIYLTKIKVHFTFSDTPLETLPSPFRLDDLIPSQK